MNTKKLITAGIILILVGVLLSVILLSQPETIDLAPNMVPAGNVSSLDDMYTASGVSMELSGTVTEGSAAVPAVLTPKADGTVVYEKNGAVVDASNLEDGYIMIRYTKDAAKLMVLITGPSGTQYRYLLNTDKAYETFPMSDGNGTYKVGVYRNISGTKYSTVQTVSLDVTLKNEFAPFLLPNQYVNYSPDSTAVAKAAALTEGCDTDLQKVAAIYDFVIKNITYDKQEAETVQSGYLPDVDEVLETEKGICFDYAALMAAMLRSQEVPTKLVVGYTGSVYHAWLNVYTEESGWVEGVIFFDGTQWKLMDPTFASSANSSDRIMEYISNGKNYQAKYLY